MTEDTSASDVNRRYARARELYAQGRQSLNEASRVTREILGEVRDARGRGRLYQQLWDCDRALGRHNQFFSQSGQDAWLERHVFKGKRDGVFVEIGGYDGVTGSNCLFFELRRGWSGFLVEPSPTFFPQAAAVRRCACHQVALAGKEGEAEFLEIREGLTQMGGLVDNYDAGLRSCVEEDDRYEGEVISVPTRTLASLLDEAGYKEIDYVSLDVEGAEMAVMEGFDFDRYRVAVWTIENNRGDVGAIPKFMVSKGYQRVERIGVDDVYLLTDE
jgi:FkbM family methyltransferase